MLLDKNLVESFRTLYQEMCGEEIEYGIAELHLKELAELVRMTGPKYEAIQNG